VLFDEQTVGELHLWILVQILHVGVRWRRIEVEVVFLDVFAVVALVAGQTEDSFFQNGIALVPQRQGKTGHLSAIADAGQAIFVPTVSAGTSVIMRQILPRVSIRGCSLRAQYPMHAR